MSGKAAVLRQPGPLVFCGEEWKVREGYKCIYCQAPVRHGCLIGPAALDCATELPPPHDLVPRT